MAPAKVIVLVNWKLHRDEDQQLPRRQLVGPDDAREGPDALRAIPASREGFPRRRVLPLPAEPTLIQYWRSFEDLERFARNPEDLHLPAWRHFNRTVGSDRSVGFWHETYIVERAKYEAIYSNMPPVRLVKATKVVPAVGRREAARRRLMRSENEPAAVPSPE